jgi:hypothetical protein
MMRVVNRLGALLLGIVLLALGLLMVVETIAIAAWNTAWPVPLAAGRRRLLSTQWSDNSVLIVSIIVLAAGLLLLISQMMRVRPKHLATTWHDDDDTWVLNRRSVERQAVAAAETIRGVEGASASTAGKPDHWRLAVKTKVVGNVVDTNQVEQAVHAEMRSLGAPDDLPVHVTVRKAKSAA